MPLEQYGSLIERLKAEEQERLQRYQESQTPLQADPAFSGAVPLEADTDAIARAEEWRRQNPPPQPSKLLTLGNVLSRLGARMEGRRPPEWVQPNDPLADFRDKMAEVIATQGMSRNTEQWKQGRIDKRREKDFERSISPEKGRYEAARKMDPSYTHPSQEEQNYATAAAARDRVRTPEERQAELRKMQLEGNELEQRVNRGTALAPFERAVAEKGVQQLTGSPSNIKQNLEQNYAPEQPLEYVGTVTEEEANNLLNSGQQVRDLRGQGGVGFQPEAAPQQPVQRPLTRPDISADMAPSGTTLHYKEVLTPEAEMAKKREEAQIAAESGHLPVEVQTRIKNNFDAYDILQNIKTLYNPQNIGPLVNAAANWQKMGGTLAPEHQAMRSEIMNLTNLLFHVRTGAAGPENEQYVQEQVAPDLYSGNPQYFLDALRRLEEMVQRGIRNDQEISNTTRGGMGAYVEQRMKSYEDRRAPSAAYQQATQGQQYPKGAPPGLVFDPRIGKWRMP